MSDPVPTATDESTSAKVDSKADSNSAKESSPTDANNTSRDLSVTLKDGMQAITPVLNALGVGTLLFGGRSNDKSNELRGELSRQGMQLQENRWGLQHLNALRNNDNAHLDTRLGDMMRIGTEQIERKGLEITGLFDRKLDQRNNALRVEIRDQAQVLRQENAHTTGLLQRNIDGVQGFVKDLSLRHNETSLLANANRVRISENEVGLREMKDALQVLREDTVRREGLIHREIDAHKDFATRLHSDQQLLSQHVLENRTMLGTTSGTLRVTETKVEQIGAQLEQHNQRMTASENAHFKWMVSLLLIIICFGGAILYASNRPTASNVAIGPSDTAQRLVEHQEKHSPTVQEELMLVMMKKLENIDTKPRQQDSFNDNSMNINSTTLILIFGSVCVLLLLLFIAIQFVNGKSSVEGRKRKHN